MSEASLLDPAFLAKLEHLSRLARRLLSRERSAEEGIKNLRHAPSAATSFQEHRSYSPGDDTRHIDWNAYGRLGELFVKVFEPEKRGEIALLLDRSASMRQGRVGSLSLELAAAFGFLGIGGLDGAALASFPGPLPERFFGEDSTMDFLRRLQDLGASRALSSGPQTLKDAAKALAAQRSRSSWTVILSDFFPAEPLEEALPLLRRSRVLCVHLFDPLDQEPPERGPSLFEDAESGRRRRLPVTGQVRENYLRLLRAHFDRVERVAREHGARCARVGADISFEAAMLGILSRGALDA